MAGDIVKCWCCGLDKPVDDVKRLDRVHSLAGYKPGLTRKNAALRVCTDCLLKWAGLRFLREADLKELENVLPLPPEPTGGHSD